MLRFQQEQAEKPQRQQLDAQLEHGSAELHAFSSEALNGEDVVTTAQFPVRCSGGRCCPWLCTDANCLRSFQRSDVDRMISDADTGSRTVLSHCTNPCHHQNHQEDTPAPPLTEVCPDKPAKTEHLGGVQNSTCCLRVGDS